MSLTFHWFLPTNGDGRDIVGITEFILSGYPHLEEAYWFGEGVLPILEKRGLWRHPAPRRADTQTTTPFAPTHATPSTREKIAAS